MTPRVTVIIPVWRPAPSYLIASVDSILKQTLEDIELILIYEKGEESAKAILSALSDQRLRFEMNPDRNGLGAALNHGVQCARADLVARMDGDDLASADRLAAQVEFLSIHADIDVVGCQIAVIDETGREIGARRYPEDSREVARTLMRYNCLPHPGVTFRKKAVIAVGGYPEAVVNEDYELWCKLATQGTKLANHGSMLLSYRYHEGALKFDQIPLVIRRGIEIKERYFAGELDLKARLRLWMEKLLLHVPPRTVLWLFRHLTYPRSEVRA